MKSKSNLKIVFFGTPDFAVASLDALVKANYEVIAVVTAPDKPSGRGLILQTTAVKKYAENKGILVLQPPNLKTPEFISQLAELNADMQVVVAFRMLPEIVWNMPPMGTLNVHGSLLPQYRGAAPINWAIMNGATETGVTTFKLKHEIDTGNILMQKKIAILPSDTAGTVHDKLMIVGADLLVETVNAMVDGSIQEIEQNSIVGSLTHAPKIFKEDMKIHWDWDVNKIINHIRGLSPYPAAFCTLDHKNIKVFCASKEITETNAPIGDFQTDGKSFLKFSAQNGWIYILELQQEGKKRMDIKSFLRGFRQG